MPEKEDKKKDLETALKEKVEPLLEQTMEKHLGITIPKIETDITDRLRQPSLSIYIPFHLPFSQAKKFFKREFLKRELQTHQGNISRLAKLINLDRRTIHRTIKDLGLKVRELRTSPLSFEQSQAQLINQAICSALEKYEEIIQPQKMEKMYEEVRSLSQNIAQFLPKEEFTWKEAEREFEKQFLQQALQENQWHLTQTAKKINLRPETLCRKVKRLGLRR